MLHNVQIPQQILQNIFVTSFQFMGDAIQHLKYMSSSNCITRVVKLLDYLMRRENILSGYLFSFKYLTNEIFEYLTNTIIISIPDFKIKETIKIGKKYE